MARRSKAEMVAEFERLYSVFSVIVDFEALDNPEMREVVASREAMLGWVESGTATLSEIIAGVQVPINEFRFGLRRYTEAEKRRLAPAERGPDMDAFLAFYRERKGLSFLADVADPIETAKQVMKRGKVRGEVEYYLMAEFLNDLDQTVFDGGKLALLENMTTDFEQERRVD